MILKLNAALKGLCAINKSFTNIITWYGRGASFWAKVKEKNKCSDRMMEVKPSALGGNYDRQTVRTTIRSTNKPTGEHEAS